MGTEFRTLCAGILFSPGVISTDDPKLIMMVVQLLVYVPTLPA
jgi:hypothetical protein